jgi:hypothetical protein
MEIEDVIEKKPGDGTARAARMLIDHLEGEPFRVLSDHGSKSVEDENIGHIVSWYYSKEGWKTPLSQIDIIVVDQSNPKKAIALIEIEETNTRPKNLLGDVLAILTGNRIRYNGEDFEFGEWTRLIVLAKGSGRHGKRNDYLAGKANNIKSILGSDDHNIGEIVIRAFDDADTTLSLETVLKGEVDIALDKAKQLLPRVTPSENTQARLEQLENELTEELRGTYEAARERNYFPRYFLQMLEEHGGKETARRLLAKQEMQQGLMTLAGMDLLSVSLEAVVLKEKYKSLFEKLHEDDGIDYLAEARRRLEEFDYFDKRKKRI